MTNEEATKKDLLTMLTILEDNKNSFAYKTINSALNLITRQQAIVEKSEKVEYFADKTIATLQTENERLRSLCDLYFPHNTYKHLT